MLQPACGLAWINLFISYSSVQQREMSSHIYIHMYAYFLRRVCSFCTVRKKKFVCLTLDFQIFLGIGFLSFQRRPRPLSANHYFFFRRSHPLIHPSGKTANSILASKIIFTLRTLIMKLLLQNLKRVSNQEDDKFSNILGMVTNYRTLFITHILPCISLLLGTIGNLPSLSIAVLFLLWKGKSVFSSTYKNYYLIK